MLLITISNCIFDDYIDTNIFPGDVLATDVDEQGSHMMLASRISTSNISLYFLDLLSVEIFPYNYTVGSIAFLTGFPSNNKNFGQVFLAHNPNQADNINFDNGLVSLISSESYA